MKLKDEVKFWWWCFRDWLYIHALTDKDVWGQRPFKRGDQKNESI